MKQVFLCVFQMQFRISLLALCWGVTFSLVLFSSPWFHAFWLQFSARWNSIFSIFLLYSSKTIQSSSHLLIIFVRQTIIGMWKFTTPFMFEILLCMYKFDSTNARHYPFEKYKLDLGLLNKLLLWIQLLLYRRKFLVNVEVTIDYSTKNWLHNRKLSML